jgi:hypothetical protein
MSGLSNLFVILDMNRGKKMDRSGNGSASDDEEIFHKLSTSRTDAIELQI